MPSTLLNALRHIPLARSLANNRFSRSARHASLVRFGPRRNYTYTRFLRFPAQFDALCGPVMEFLQSGKPVAGLRVVVIGCANGAEAYTIASLLHARFPGLEFNVAGYDLQPEQVAEASAAVYKRSQVGVDFNVPPEFVSSTFDIDLTGESELFMIKPEIRRRVSFDVADALDRTLLAKTGSADIVFAQNFLYHLKPRRAKIAFENIVTLLKPRAALFIDGMDLGLRSRMTRQHGLAPLESGIEEIHAEAYQERGASWPAIYWGLEALSKERPDWRYRYGTIFLRPSTR